MVTTAQLTAERAALAADALVQRLQLHSTNTHLRLEHGRPWEHCDRSPCSGDLQAIAHYLRSTGAAPVEHLPPTAEPSDVAGRLGQRVKALRHQHNWTLSYLAQRAGMSKGGLSEIESGMRNKIGAVTAVRLANALGIGVPALLGMEEASGVLPAVPAEAQVP